MYRTGQKYKLQLRTGIVYTAEILKEDKIQILIKTIRGEEIILSKEDIRQSKLIEQDRTGDEDVKQKF